MTLELDLSSITELHHAGELLRAKELYTAYLQANPEDANAWHLQGLLLAELGEAENALTHLRQAVMLAPEDISIQLNLANILKAKGDKAAAKQQLLSMLAKKPVAAAYNNLGTIFFSEKNWHEAEKHFHQALDLQPNYLDAYYNLGLTQMKVGQSMQAINTFEALLQLAPNHTPAQFQLAALFMQRGAADKALAAFLQIIAKHPFHVETLVNIATLYLQQGNFLQAKTYYLQALDITPEDVQILFNLAVITMQQNKVREAINYYLQIVKLDPAHFSAHHNLGAAFLATGDIQQALLHFRAALALQPGNTGIAHTIRILQQDKTVRTSPPEYVRDLFDSYADHYDEHLKRVLDYQVPQAIFKLLQQHMTFINKTLDILDLGCGTGLCGELFAPFAKYLVGVDISTKMLSLAEQKKCYDQLVAADLLSFLQADTHHYDLILAADVIVYYGEIEALFRAISERLSVSAKFIFNVEIAQEADFYMTTSGRFAHRENYIATVLQAANLTLVATEKILMRTEKQVPVYGMLYLCERISC